MFRLKYTTAAPIKVHKLAPSLQPAVPSARHVWQSEPRHTMFTHSARIVNTTAAAICVTNNT